MRYQDFYPFANNDVTFDQTWHQNPPHFYSPPTAWQPTYPYTQSQAVHPDALTNQNPQTNQQQGSSKMEAYMQTADKFLNTAQQFAPVVQQIAPIVRNLPAMWRLYRGFQSMPPNEGPASSLSSESPSMSSPSQSSQASVPRIFQPPHP